MAIDDMNKHVLNIIAVPFGLAACWIVFQILKRSWKKKYRQENIEVLDDEFIDE